MASATPPARPRSCSPSGHHSSNTSLIRPPPRPPPVRPPRSLSRPSNITIALDAILQSTPRKRGTGGLALQARDSLSVRKRTMSTGAMSARLARHNARKANLEVLQATTRNPDGSTSSSSKHRNHQPSPFSGPADPHGLRTPSPSSSSSSQSPTPITPGQPPLSGAPSSFQGRGRTHVPHDSQGTTTSAYPPSSSISMRSSSPSPEGSRTPSLVLPRKPSLPLAPVTASLDLDPDDVNARLRLLVNNNYFLPPAHAKPALSRSRPFNGETRGPTSPNAFKDFFRVGKKKDRKVSEPSGYTSEGARRSPRGKLFRVASDGSPSSSGSDGRFDSPCHADGYFDIHSQDERVRNRVVVVRETVEDLPPPMQGTLLRAHTYNSLDAVYNDPTMHYDVPPPTHFPSFVNLRLDTAGITGNVEVDKFVPPGEPWSPTPSSPISGMDPQERVWRRAILEQAVDLSLSSANSEVGILEGGSFVRGGGINSEESSRPGDSALGVVIPTDPKSPKSKRSWWGWKDKDVDEGQRRPSTSSSPGRDLRRNSGSHRGTHSLEVDSQSQQSLRRVRDQLVGRPILPNMQAELEEFDREFREQELGNGLPPPLRLKLLGSTGAMSLSAPVTPLFDFQSPPDVGTSTILRPPPQRRGEKSRNAPSDVASEFMPGHSTIRKSLSSPLLSDLHEAGMDVQQRLQFSSASIESLDGVAAPSFVLQDPSGVTSLVTSNTMDSFSSGSHYQEDDDHDFGVMTSAEHLPEEDSVSLEHWHAASSSLHDGSRRPSLDSFGPERVRSPEYHPRASSTFGFRRSNISVSTPSPLRERAHGLEADISGDPVDHLSVMERSSTPSGGYVSALDYTFTRSEAPSIGRPVSPATMPMRSTGTRVTSSLAEPNESGMESEAPIQFFDSIQHESFMNEDGDSSDSEDDTPQVNATSFTVYHEQSFELPILTRKSFNSARPTPAFTTQFRNASQPQLPVTRTEGPPPFDTLRPMMSYDLLDRKKPLTNTPLSAPTTASSIILSQIKEKRSKSPVKTATQFFGIRKKRSGGSPVLLPESTFDMLRYPSGNAFSLGSSAGTSTATTRSEPDSVVVKSRAFDGARSQGSLLSIQSSDTVSFQHAGSIQNTQNESLRKLDGMMMQHLEAERDRLRKIANAAKERSESSRDGHQI